MSYQYVALLRGINVGGHSQVKMIDLKNLMEQHGYRNVKTLLNSGNVVFEAEGSDTEKITRHLADIYEKQFGFSIDTIVRPMTEIQNLIESDPFASIEVTPDTRLYITFLATKPNSSLAIPYESPEKDFRILQVTDHEIVSVLTLSANRRTTDVMNILEKEFGKKVTTRNWNTVLKIGKLALK